MPRNTKDFSDGVNPLEGQTCSQPGCKEQATRHSWADGYFCSDCDHENQSAANESRSKNMRKDK